MDTTNNVAGQGTGMLEIFDSIQVRNEEKISQSDLKFCERQQEAVNQVLMQQKNWYDIFLKSAQELKETYKVEFQTNGMVVFKKPYDYFHDDKQDYKRYEFTPFEAINEIIESRQNTIERFSGDIIRYFNCTYSLAIPTPDFDKKNTPVDFVPNYMSYVDTVIAHLGGRSFRHTAEEELIERVQTNVHRYERHPLPEIKSKSIVFHNLFGFDNFNLQYGQFKIGWNDSQHIEALCAGLAFYGQNRISGDSGIICGFDKDNVNITDWYSLSTSPAEYIKFYKNGRIDVKFSDTASAEECFRKLKLEEL